MKSSIPNTESLETEFKSDVKQYPDTEIVEVITALTNTEGGTLYLGVEDDGKITGVHEKHKNYTELSAYVANHTVPPVSITVEMLDEIKPVLKINVPKTQGGIVATTAGKILRRRLKADGKPENVPLYPAEFMTRLSDLRLTDYSTFPLTEATTDDFDPLEIERLRKNIIAYDGDKLLAELSNEELFKAAGFVREQNGKQIPTILGILMIGRTESIERHIPTNKTSFQVIEGSEVLVNEDFTLPILASLEKIAAYLEVWNKQNEIEIGLFRMPAPDFDKRALREAVVNAYSHRDYTKLGRIRIAILDEGIIISNPGGFIEGVNIKNLLTAEPHGRNPALADALKRTGLAERTGRGIDRIYEGSLIYGKPLPDYSASTNVMVSLFIPRSSPDPQLTRIISNEHNRLGRPLSLNMLLVLNFLKDMPHSNTQRIASELNIPETMVRMTIENAVKNELVEAYGKGRGRNYILSSKFYITKQEKLDYIRQLDIKEMRYEELILNFVEKNEYICRADVIELLHLNSQKAYFLLKKMVDEGKLELINKGKYAKYALKEK